MTEPDPVDEEIQRLMAKPSLDEAETIRLQILMEGTPERWTWSRSYRWLRDRLSRVNEKG